MSRYIDADALMEQLWDAETRIGYVQVVDARTIIDAPTADVVPVVHGHWEKCNEVHVEFPDGFKGTIYDAKCSVCGHLQNPSVMEQYGQLHFDYCPRCGAKMDESTIGQVNNVTK